MKLKTFLGLDESTKSANKISDEIAEKVYDKLNYTFDFDEFVKGMNVELEHADVTGGDLILTAKIAAAHLREVSNYYTLLKLYVEN